MLTEIFWRTLRVPFVRDIATMQVGRVVYMGLTLLSSVFFVRLLGVERYGTYAVVLAFASTFKVFLNFGQTTSLQVFLAEAHGRGNRNDARAILGTFAQLTALTGLLLVGLAVAAPWITQALYGDRTVGLFAACVFVFSILDLLNGGLLSVLQSLRRIQQKVWLEQAANATFILSSIAALFLGWGVAGIFFCQLASGAIFVCISAVTYVRVAREEGLPRMRDVLSVPLRDTREYIKQSLLFSVDKNVINLFPSSILFALSLVAPVATVGTIRLALQLAAVPASFLLPQVTELSTSVLAAMDPAKIRTKAIVVLKHTVVLQIFICIGALAVMPPLIPLVYGHEALTAIRPMTAFILLSLIAPFAVVNTPLLRLYRRTLVSTVTALAALGCMWGAIFFLQDVLGAVHSFYLAYALQQIIPLGVTVYILFGLLRKEPPSVRRENVIDVAAEISGPTE